MIKQRKWYEKMLTALLTITLALGMLCAIKYFISLLI